MSRQTARQLPSTDAEQVQGGHEDRFEHDLAVFLISIQAGLDDAHAKGRPIFATDASGLFDIYLNSFATDRQYHNCHACRHFVERFGGLVSIADDGVAVPLLWRPSEVAGFYHHAARALRARVARSKVTGVFLTAEPMLGTPLTRRWTHLAASVPASMRHRHAVLSAGQAAAEKAMDFQTVQTALAHFDPACLDTALGILQAEALPMSERFVGPLAFLRDIHVAQAAARTAQSRTNVLWRAVATAPAGFCHPSTSMTGTLLEDILNRHAMDDIRRRFAARAAPSSFQRPQAPPRAGAIDAAERIFETMRLRPSLKRRYARLEDLLPVWRPVPERTEPGARPGSVFGHLVARKPRARASGPVSLPSSTLTWEKFARTVLPGARSIELLVPRGDARFIAFTTAEHPEAPPLLKWDRPDERNPVAWYVYPQGSPAARWNLVAGSYCAVTAVVPLPTMWGSQPMPHEGDGMVLVLEGCRDRPSASACLFPQFMRQELHPVRSVIEAYSETGSLSGAGEATGCGFDVRHSPDSINATLRVRSGATAATYVIDRWD